MKLHLVQQPGLQILPDDVRAAPDADVFGGGGGTGPFECGFDPVRCQGREEMSAESRFEKSPHHRWKCPLDSGCDVVLAVKSLLSRTLVNETASVFEVCLGKSLLFAEIDVV